MNLLSMRLLKVLRSNIEKFFFRKKSQIKAFYSFIENTEAILKS